MSTEWTPARIELAKLCYSAWTAVEDTYKDGILLVLQGYAEMREGSNKYGGHYIKLTPAGRDALDREIGDTA